MPQRGISYVHVGRSNVLFSRSLFSTDTCECLPMIQYIRLNESSNCFFLACMCVRHVSRRSKCNPRYLALSLWRMVSFVMGDLKVERLGFKFCLGLGKTASKGVKLSQLLRSQCFGEDGRFWFSQLTRRENSSESCECSCRPSTARIDENTDKVCKIVV
jgi:hypothetical protein